MLLLRVIVFVCYFKCNQLGSFIFVFTEPAKQRRKKTLELFDDGEDDLFASSNKKEAEKGGEVKKIQDQSIAQGKVYSPGKVYPPNWIFVDLLILSNAMKESSCWRSSNLTTFCEVNNLYLQN